ncbi:MAG: hydantoinase/oxoprolinase family protein [Cytophagales bacterium]|nr:MAG: hydantoinase/oxoprolinase family protein [Cytophagales bacterium]
MLLMKLGIDIGGTFTDLVLLNEQDGAVVFAKTLTTYPDPTEGILTGVQEIVQKSGIESSQIDTLVHGTTLVTNAVIERKGAKTALLTTKGFEDVLEIGREMRYDIYDIFITMPKPLVPAHLRRGVTERLDKQGVVVESLRLDEAEQHLLELQAEGVQSVAVSFLHSFANTAHEKAVGQLIESKFPGLTYSLSCDVMPEIREYERTSATVMNAYVQPLTDEYLKNLRTRLNALGFAGIIHIMDSAGRLTTLEGARKTPVQLLESGPAGGTMAGVFFGHLTGKSDLLAFDMGGTTAKASMIRDRGDGILTPEITNQFEAAREKRFKRGSGLPVRIPVIDMIEIGAGGGSIAHVNALGLLTVGPESAASTPGPACYGRGGQNPTVTDADLVLGFLNEHYFLGGTMSLRKDLARQAIDLNIAQPLGISVEEAAWGIHRIVNENMANAARVHILEKGLDPRFFSMMAFGGAGPVHAFNVARLLNTPQLLVPSGAGVLSAFGFLVSPVAKEAISSYVCRLDRMDWNRVNERIAEMKQSGYAFLDHAGVDATQVTVKIVADMRYLGQGHEITVSIPDGSLDETAVPQIEAAFGREYQLRYGRSIDRIPIESVTWRVLVSGPSPRIIPRQTLHKPAGQAQKGTRPVFWGKTYEDTPVYDRYSLRAHEPVLGPCIIEEFESTTVVGKNSTAHADEFGNLVIDLTY